MTDVITTTRIVLHVGGYDARSPGPVHGRFVEELRRFEKIWASRVMASDPTITEDCARWSLVSQGPNWQVRTDYRLLRWDDIIVEYEQGPLWRRILRGTHAFFDFVAGGALIGYIRNNWRYAGFFLYPFVLLGILTTLAVLIGTWAERASGTVSIGVLAGLAALAGLVQGPGRRLHLPLLLDDWTFSRSYIKRPHPVLDARLDRMAEELVAAAREQKTDEIVLVGHSLGAVLAVDLLDRALSMWPELGRSGARLVLLSVGSSILKIGLHRGARRFRASLQRVATARGVFWGEYQSLTDVMNFYRTDPVRSLGLTSGRPPFVRLVRFRNMLSPPAYRRLRRNFFRVHCQFIRANDCRASYDYFMFVCGPLAAQTLVESPRGATPVIGPDGRLISSLPLKTPNPEFALGDIN